MDREFLQEIATILEESISYPVEDSRGTRYIRIEVNSARETAERLRDIANRLPNMVH